MIERRRLAELVVNSTVIALLIGAGIMVGRATNFIPGLRAINVCETTSDHFSPCPGPWEIAAQGETLIVTVDTRLRADHLGPIVVAADGITLDCDGYTLRDGAPVGIDLTGRHDVEVTNCTVAGFDVGISLSDSTSSRISGNYAYANGVGFALQESAGSRLINNSAELNGTGFVIDGLANGAIADNVVAGGHLGFRVKDTVGTILENNRVADVNIGFEIDDSRGNTFRANDLVGSEWGVAGPAVTAGNVFSDNLGLDISVPLVVTEDLTLEAGHDGTIVIATDGITLDCAGHQIRDPRRRDGAWSNRIEVGIDISRHTGVTIENCGVVGYEHGIVMWQADNNTVRNTEAGIYLEKSHDNHVTDSRPRNVSLRRSHRNTIADNLIFGSGDIELRNARRNVIRGNTLGVVGANSLGRGPKIVLMKSQKNTVRDNTVKAGEEGFYVADSSGNTFRGNVTIDNTFGFWLDDSSNNHFEHNDASASSTPYHGRGSSYNNTFSGNLSF